jgi:hypothetical protein
LYAGGALAGGGTLSMVASSHTGLRNTVQSCTPN